MQARAKRRQQLLTPDQQAEHDQKIVDEFNARFPVGTRVWYWKTLPFGPVVETTVRGPAFTSDAGLSVCFLTGISGYVSTMHVREIDESRRQDLNFESDL